MSKFGESLAICEKLEIGLREKKFQRKKISSKILTSILSAVESAIALNKNDFTAYSLHKDQPQSWELMIKNIMTIIKILETLNLLYVENLKLQENLKKSNVLNP